MENWEMVIGLEVHIQLNTKSKAFCADENRFGAEPNSLVSAISLAHPGTLPHINQRQIAKAMRLGLALNSQISEKTYFDRKNYFYADLPKGYQITQDTAPICIGGEVKLSTGKIRLHHIHMEEDAGKSIHDVNPNSTLIDLNRAGVPLLELVTEPDFRSADEVEEFLLFLRQLVRWLDVSDGNMEEGSLRCDVNLSLRPKGAKEYGTRCEIKNLNSTRFARQAIAFEAQRQAELLARGEVILQQTRQFDTVTGITKALRDKEEAHDYRYFPDPDLPPIIITPAELSQAKAALPELPHTIMQRWMSKFKLKKSDAALLCQTRNLAIYFDKLSRQTNHPVELAQFLLNKLIPYSKSAELELSAFPEKSILQFIDLLGNKKVAKSVAYQKLFPEWAGAPDQLPEMIAEGQGILLSTTAVDDTTQLIEELLAAHPKEVESYKKGKKNLMGFFMGQLMRSAQGNIDPAVARAAIAKALEA